MDNVSGEHASQGWAELDGNGHYWLAQQPPLPPSYYATPADPLVSADYQGWWARGVALIKQIWKPAALLHGAVAVPTLALSMPVQRDFQREQDLFNTAQAAAPTTLPPVGDLLLAALITFAAGLVTGALLLITMSATVQLVVFAATGQPVRLGPALRAALRRAHALLGWGALALLITVGALLLCILPIFYAGAVLAVLPVVVTLERGVGVGRCFQLFHANFGVSAARVGTLFGLGLAALLVTSVVIVAADQAGGAAGLAVEAVLNWLYAVAVGVLGVPLLVLTYADMRSRHEPFSTAYLMPAPAAPAP